MSFRDRIREQYNDLDLGSVVGCGIDRLKEEQKEKMTEMKINKVVQYYNSNKERFKTIEVIGAKREEIMLYCEREFFNTK